MEICNRSAENSRCVDQTSRLEVVEARKRRNSRVNGTKNILVETS